MQAGDLPGVLAVAAVVHPDFPERPEIFAEKLRLWPSGCLVLTGVRGAVEGYAISHPWHAGRAAPLDTLLGKLPQPEGARWIHDVALLPEARGHRAASALVRRLVVQAAEEGAPALSLVAVHGSAPFWRAMGFSEAAPGDLAPGEVEMIAASYGAQARFMARRL
jgi:ribosomal protein S18 acetylase RimI-like enzyme